VELEKELHFISPWIDQGDCIDALSTEALIRAGKKPRPHVLDQIQDTTRIDAPLFSEEDIHLREN